MSNPIYQDLKFYRLACHVFYRRFRFFIIANEKAETEQIAALAAWEAEIADSGDNPLNVIQNRIRAEICNYGFRFDNDTGKYELPETAFSLKAYETTAETRFAAALARVWSARLVIQKEKRAANEHYRQVRCSGCGSDLFRHKCEIRRNKTQKFYCDSRCQAQVQRFKRQKAIAQ